MVRLITKWLWVFLLIFMVVQPVFTHKILPDKIVVHFDIDAIPQLWMGKEHFYILWYLITLLTNSLTVTLPFILERIPRWVWSIPNKDYWIENPQNKEAAIEIASTTVKVTSLMVNLMLFLLFQCILEFTTIGMIYTPYWLVSYLELAAPIFFFAHPLIKYKNPSGIGFPKGLNLILY